MWNHRLIGCLLTLAAVAGLVAPAAAQPVENPFALVNVIDLFNFFYLDTDPNHPFDPNNPLQADPSFDPYFGQPANWARYQANARLGTQPCAVVVHGNRLWIGGFYNGVEYLSGGNDRLAWYASVGVGEVRNIYTTSGFDGSLIKFPAVTYTGPTISNSDLITGVDYDPVLKRLYFSFDDQKDEPAFVPAGGGIHLGSYIGAVDVDPNSPGYGTYIWRARDPFTPAPGGVGGDRFYGGVAVDPFDPTTLYIAQNGIGLNPATGGGFRRMNVNDPNQVLAKVNVKDPNSVCGNSFYRQVAFDAFTGDMFARNANAAEWIPRDTRFGATFRPFSYMIEEPQSGGDGVASTPAAGDDIQLVNVGAAVTPGQNIVGAGPNGVIDSTPGGDDRLAYAEVVSERPIGNKDIPEDDGTCNDDPVHGFPNGPFGQGQGIAVVSASNLTDLAEDIVIGNNRRTYGSNQPTDIGIFTLDGGYVGQLAIPCAPVAAPGSGVAIYDLDYDETTGTLAVVQFEQSRVFVYRAQTAGGPRVSKFDYTRNGRTDLADFAGFQACFTGPVGPIQGATLLNCLRMNSDSDCDIDLLDWFEFFDAWEADFGA